jgi:rhamnose utilization protein RhaD (predicted bifunctional aldolase and dehydrogenase)
MMQPAELQHLKEISARVGRDMSLVQGAGGNTSVKEGAVLWVKASGAWLSEADKRDIFVPVDLPGALRALAQGIERMPVADPAATLRPSIETSLHALLPHRLVLHVHAVNTIAWASCLGVEQEIAKRLDGLSWARVPYRRPGLPLSQVVAETLAQRRPDVLILGNHGLLVGGADCAAAEALVHELERRLHLPVRPAPAGDRAALETLCRGTEYRAATDEACHRLATDPHSLAIATQGSLYPDHVVFLGPAMRAISVGERIADVIASSAAAGLPAPVALLVPGARSCARTSSPAPRRC